MLDGGGEGGGGEGGRCEVTEKEAISGKSDHLHDSGELDVQVTGEPVTRL